jgi:hypothetical protein
MRNSLYEGRKRQVVRKTKEGRRCRKEDEEGRKMKKARR